MHHNQTNSTFKMPIAPHPPPSQSETLLFNDILEEKTLALRNTFNEFLQVQPYRKFDIEFSNFLKRTKQIIHEAKLAGANVSRINNSSQITSLYPRPSASFNSYKPLTPMSMTSSSTSNRNSVFRLPQTSFQPIEQVNPFKPPINICFEPRVVLPRIEQSIYNHESPSHATVTEVNQAEHESARTNNVHISYQPSEHSEPKERSLSKASKSTAVPNSYSDVTLNDDMSVSSSQHNSEHNEINNESNSIESLLEGVGFKILLPGDSQNDKKSNASQVQNQLNLKENVEKYLSTWSLNMKIIKTNLNPPRVVLLLTGTLLERDQVTIIDKRHDAGYLESRKEKNLVRTNHGLYRLIGNIISGHPNELYQLCLDIKGIPRTWRSNVKQLTGVEKEKTSKNEMLNFSLESPSGPSIQKKPSLLDMSKTRNGKNYNKFTKTVSQKSIGKRKIPESDVPEISKSKHRKFFEKVPPLLASTPKRPRKPVTMMMTPSQILKNKILQNMNSKTKVNSDSRAMKSINDSIQVTKKRHSNSSKDQTNVFLKPKVPTKTSLSSNNSTKNSRKSGENSSIRSLPINHSNQTPTITNQSKQTSINRNQSKLTSINNSTTLNCSLSSQSKSKSSLNNTQNSSRVSKSKIPPKVSISPKVVKVLKPTQLSKIVKKKRLASRQLLNKDNIEEEKVVKKKKTEDCPNICKNTKVSIEKPKSKPKKKPCSSSAELGLFDNVVYDDYCNVSDFNIMGSPSKLSMVSRNDKSRSETPPLFNLKWSTGGKSLVFSEPPTPLSKSVEAKALKRVKAPKLTLGDEIKYLKGKNKKESIDYDTVSKKINKMLEFGEQYDNDDD